MGEGNGGVVEQHVDGWKVPDELLGESGDIGRVVHVGLLPIAFCGVSIHRPATMTVLPRS